MPRLMFALTFLLLILTSKGIAQKSYQPDSVQQRSNISLRPLPQNFYTQHLGFFCKSELKVQRQLPIFFRLGSKDYVDYLEKKPGAAIKPN